MHVIRGTREAAIRVSIRSRETAVMHPGPTVSYRQEGPLSSKAVPMGDKMRAERGLSDLDRRQQMLTWARAMRPTLYSAYIRADSQCWHSFETKRGRKDSDGIAKTMFGLWEQIENAFNTAQAVS